MASPESFFEATFIPELAGYPDGFVSTGDCDCETCKPDEKIDGTMKFEPVEIIVNWSDAYSVPTAILTKDDIVFIPRGDKLTARISVKVLVALLDIHEHAWGGG